MKLRNIMILLLCSGFLDAVVEMNVYDMSGDPLTTTLPDEIHQELVRRAQLSDDGQIIISNQEDLLKVDIAKRLGEGDSSEVVYVFKLTEPKTIQRVITTITQTQAQGTYLSIVVKKIKDARDYTGCIISMGLFAIFLKITGENLGIDD